MDAGQGVVQLAAAIRERWPDLAVPPLVVGIRTGGLWLAQKLCEELSLPPPASLDISYHRDDLAQRGMNPHAKASELPLNIDGREILLVDDVLHTGRTVRAALNELFDYGRPSAVLLAVLIDRSGRELPIAAQFVAYNQTLAATERLKIDGPDPLRIRVVQA